MKTITLSDIIFVTVIRRGFTVAMMRLSGLTSIGEVIARLRSKYADVRGMVTLSLRNGTRGWVDRRAVML